MSRFSWWLRELHARRPRFLKAPGPIRLRLVVMLSLTITPLAAFGISQAIIDYHRDLSKSEADLVRNAQFVTDVHSNLILGMQEVLTALSAQQVLREGIQPACREALTAVVNTLPQFGTIAVIGRDGQVRCAHPESRENIDVSDQPWFRNIIDTRGFVASDIIQSRLSEDRAIVTAVPLRGDGEALAGVLAATISWAWLISSTPQLDLPDDAFTLLIDADGSALPLAKGLEGLEYPDLPPIDLAQAAYASSIAVMRTRDVHGKELLLAVTPPLNHQIRFVLGRSAESLFSPSRLKLAGRLAIPVLILAATIIAAWIAGNRMFIRWIVYLQRFAGIYAGGRYSVRPQNMDAAPTELRELANSLSSMMEEISERDHQLKDELAHREFLIKEIHHRVKNNLQIIASLINLQTRRLSDDTAKDAMLDLRRRIDALALIHRSVYESEDLVSVDLKEFFNGLNTQLSSVVGEGHQDISLTVDIPSIKVSPDVAIALAMMAIEAVTNAYRHAFVGRSHGSLSIRLEKLESGAAVLSIEDDGSGFDLALQRSHDQKGLGKTLMEGIARQLGGRLMVESANGTKISLEIPKLA